ncbi:hypothetical protein AOL_s00081g360 [Orbilia oligospora ATCC 24927]|uniref:Uncharacterized protein n=2 Tax=Orbilia oligospora TaxID=2813651 RepID=G1XG67_ARTOA|nr:hypothetical protein AOL_s00081g360 [Orbilia oligospora ATCC 24927]EGX48033.1 hypothetical protein AOL_s00081g360 [Orbilia oligospora ATCC 24927]KAF3274444.1 hypothetical protein TWF970_007958 [Orbilia oligospora]
MSTTAAISRSILPRWPNGLLRLQTRGTIIQPSPMIPNSTKKRFLRIPPKFQKPSQPVLEQPTKYTPPSHPTGPRTTAARESAHKPLPQKPHVDERKHYPGMMPPPGTITHWILHSPKLHGLVAVSVLVSLALYVMYRNFMENDEAAQLAYFDWKHPIMSAQSFVQAYRESDRINTARIMEKRRQISEDMERKAHYRYVVEGKVGGPGEGLGSWGVRRTQKDQDFGWGIIIDGKTIDKYIVDKEKEKAEKRRLKEGGEDGGEDGKAPVIQLDEKPVPSPSGDQKKTWW